MKILQTGGNTIATLTCEREMGAGIQPTYQ